MLLTSSRAVPNAPLDAFSDNTAWSSLGGHVLPGWDQDRIPSAHIKWYVFIVRKEISKMSSKLVALLRIMVIVTLSLLVIQFELGMAVNLSPTLLDIPPFGFSINAIAAALYSVGFVALIHATVGGVLVILSVINLVMALLSGIRGAQIFGTLAFLSTILSAMTGVMFVLSGFQNDGLSHGMATNFILAFVFYFIELYVLKPNSRVQAH